MELKYWETRAEIEMRRNESADDPTEQDIELIENEPDKGHSIADQEAGLDTVEQNTEDQNAVVNADAQEALQNAEESFEEPTSATEIVDLNEVRKERDDQARIDHEVEEFFASEQAQEQVPRKNRIAKYIFVDGLLGIPFMAVFSILISVLVVVFALSAAVLLAASLAMIAGAVLLAVYSVGALKINPQTGVLGIGAAFALIGLGLFIFVLSIIIASRLVPFIGSLVDRLALKLRLFRN